MVWYITDGQSTRMWIGTLHSLSQKLKKLWPLRRDLGENVGYITASNLNMLILKIYLIFQLIFLRLLLYYILQSAAKSAFCHKLLLTKYVSVYTAFYRNSIWIWEAGCLQIFKFAAASTFRQMYPVQGTILLLYLNSRQPRCSHTEECRQNIQL